MDGASPPRDTALSQAFRVSCATTNGGWRPQPNGWVAGAGPEGRLTEFTCRVVFESDCGEQVGMTGIDEVIEGRAVAPLREADATLGVIERFRCVVATVPNEIAVIDGDRHVSFAEVAAEAAAVRAAVRGQQLPPGTPVAVLHTHSAGAVSTIVGALASGH